MGSVPVYSRDSGVQDRMFGVFHDAGYKRLYGGLGNEAIKRIGGVMPEQIPPAEHINEVEKRIKTTPPVLELDDKDAKWLLRHDDER